jgi:hypothetical protein
MKVLLEGGDHFPSKLKILVYFEFEFLKMDKI